MDMYAVDFGTGMALAIHGPTGPVLKRDLKLPRVAGGKTPRDEFRLILAALLGRGDVVVESATVGSSGCEVDDVRQIIAASPNELVTLSGRAVKNYRLDHGLNWRKGARYVKDGTPAPQNIALEAQADVHVEDAEIIYMIATTMPRRLRVWHEAEELERIHTSVRPMDKRGYRDQRSDAFMARLPAFALLPTELQEVLGVGGDYSRSMVMPFAMALTEPHLAQGPPQERRARFEKIIGLYEHGYPSFYRRMTVVWMQKNAKMISGATRMADVSPVDRKAAWKITQRQIRHLLHLSP